jgi:molybdopterin-guanine dinucleotide biosynthesis protein A
MARSYHRLRNLHEYITNALPSKPGAGVEGAILAGGKSRRMGRDKLLLPLGPGTLLERVEAALRPLVDRIRVIGRDPRPEIGVSAQPDLRPGLGPLSGIHAALATARAGNVMVVACDLPFVTTAFLRGLLERLSPEVEAVVPCPEGKPVAVCALYRASCLETLESRLNRGELAAGDFARSLKARFLDDRDLRAIDPSGRSLLNLNTPSDYEKALSLLKNESKT